MAAVLLFGEWQTGRWPGVESSRFEPLWFGFDAWLPEQSGEPGSFFGIDRVADPLRLAGVIVAPLTQQDLNQRIRQISDLLAAEILTNEDASRLFRVALGEAFPPPRANLRPDDYILRSGTATVTSIDRARPTITVSPQRNYLEATPTDSRRVQGFPAPLALRANRRR